MKDCKRGSQIEKLILYLEGNKPVPLDVALPIAEGLQKYLDREFNTIEEVLCRRERSDRKNLQSYDLGLIASLKIPGSRDIY